MLSDANPVISYLDRIALLIVWTTAMVERITVHTQMLGHAVLARAANKNGVHCTRELAGHTSDRHIGQFAQQSKKEEEEAQDGVFP